MKNIFIPYLMLNRIWSIDEALLHKHGIKALIVDVDNTLSTHGHPDPNAEVMPWIKKMQKAGIPLVILSNNTEKRVAPFANKLGLEFECFAVKPMTHGFKRAAKKLGLSKSEIGVVGDQIFTDVCGGNLAGMKTILTEPIEIEKQFFLSFKRKFEKPFINSYKKRHK